MNRTQWKWSDSAMATLAPPPRVLVAEDDGEIRALITTVLRQDDYMVFEAERGDQLLEMLASPSSRNPPDLIVSDVRLPGASGLDALACLREYDRLTPIVLVSAYVDDATRERAKDLSIHRIFEKPFDLIEFRELILRLAPVQAFQHNKWPPVD